VRRTCEFVWQHEFPEEPCGKPAVDFVERNGGELWLCAEHYDGAMWIDKLLLDALNYVTDKFRRGEYEKHWKKRKGL
jgi:hypothetical protein